MADDLHYLSAAEALALFKSRKLSPVELLGEIIKRSNDVEDGINAFSYEYFTEAMDLARQAEQAYINGSARVLEGIPLALKDENALAGKITSNGSILLQDYVPEKSDVGVERLLDAGVIIHARTTTPEFSCSFVTCNRLWGITRNPWNLSITPGGSSGGSGASLAAGTTTLASGSDIAGSIRVPASQNGVVGFKPPYGRVPQPPPWNLDTFCHEGSMARNVEDCRLMQNVIAGPHPSDIASLKPGLVIPAQDTGLQGWRIAYSIDLGFVEVDEDVQKNTHDALNVFRELGATVEEVNPDWTEECMQTEMTHWLHLSGSYYRQIYGDEKTRHLLTDYARWFIEQEDVPMTAVLRAVEHATEMYASLARIFENYNLFITPSTATTNIAADYDYSNDEIFINNKKVDPVLGWVMTYPFNILSRCPVLSIPSGLASNNVPTGIQLVGPSYTDSVVFQAGAAFERERGQFISPANLPSLC